MIKPNNYRPLLAISGDAKTIKGEKYGYLTGILYLAPAETSGVANLCPKSTAGCRAACLFSAGRASGTLENNPIQQARVSKTLYMVQNPQDFKASLRHDITMLVNKANKQGLIPAVRINGTSDLPKLAMEFAREFPNVQFYDYTKIPKPWKRTLPNYSLTFSLSEDNLAEAKQVLENGGNVAVVFDTVKGEALPETYLGHRVIDGDLSDLRFVDPKNVIVGLRAKGKAKKDESGFVQITL